MNDYVSLLRGLNVGGNNKVSMAELKEVYKDFGFNNIETIGNTGVIFFETDKEIDDNELGIKLTNYFGFGITLITLNDKEIEYLINNKPEWWQEREDWKYNVIFTIGDFVIEEVINDYEFENDKDKVSIINNVLFWAVNYSDRKIFYKSKYHKLGNNKFYKRTTIRNGNTLAKMHKKFNERNK
ncbi:MAG: DUF1697 domain-containing protein [Erysipelotrichales bacterium]